MPDYLNSVATANAYPQVSPAGAVTPAGATIFPPDVSTDSIVFDVGNQPVFMRVWRYTDDGRQTVLEDGEQLIAAALGNVLQNVAGAMWRSAIPGSPAIIIAKRYLLADQKLQPGLAFTGILSASGGLAPPVTTPQVIVLHNGVQQGVEQGLNLIDAVAVGNPAASLLTWSVNDNPGSSRVDVTPAIKVGVQHNDAGQVNEPVLDLEDAVAAALPGIPGLTWTITDDAANNRVKVTPVLTGGPALVVNPPDKITADVTVASITSPGTTVITSTSKTYLNRLTRIRFFTPRVERTVVSNATNTCRLVLQKDGAVIADPWGRVTVDHISTGGLLGGTPVCLEYWDTPTAAAHTYTVSAYALVASEFVVGAGAGGGSVPAPAVLSIDYPL